MTLQEKFDDIISRIERLIDSGVDNIPQILSQETGFNLRLLGDSFQFITDMTLIKYIRQRRLIYALTRRIEKNLSIEEIAADSLFSDAAAFTKACKSEFNLAPGQITADVLKKYPPLRFSLLVSDNQADLMENKTLVTQQHNTSKGVSVEEFSEIRQVLEISALYGFDDEESEYVYRLTKELGLTIEAAAEFCEEIRLEEKYDVFSYEMQQALCEVRHNGYAHIHELPDGFFDVYFSEENDKHGWFVPYICEITEALNRNGMCAADLEEIALHADTYDVDIIEAIENFDEYEKHWDCMTSDAIAEDVLDDDTGHFGYRSIWEFDEDEKPF